MKAAACFLLSLGIALGTPSRAKAQQVFEELLDDGSANDSGYQGYVHNGSFVTGGWQTTVMDSRIRFDLNAQGGHPDGIACGTVEVELSNFDPITNFQGACGTLLGGDECYSNIIGIYEGDHGNNGTAFAGLETQLQVQASCEQCFDDHPGDQGRDRRFKYKGSSSDWNVQSNIFNDYLTPSNDIAWESHLDRHYLVSLTWSCGTVDYRLEFDGTPHTSSGSWTWINAPSGARPNMRHVFIGKDYCGGDKWIQDVIYHRVKVTKNEPCDCADLPVCGDGVIEGAEECDGTYLAGQTCASLGYSGGALACTAGCAFELSGCSSLLDAGIDSSMGEDAGDAGPFEDAGDAGPFEDAGGGGHSANGGCSCRADRVPVAGGWPFLILVLALFFAFRRKADG